MQAFANDIAAHLGAQSGALVEAPVAGSQGVIFSSGRHVILGIPADPVVLEQ
jgi:hypothetical protein